MIIQVDSIILDTALQPREEINSNAVQQYADEMKQGENFPPIEVVYDGNNYYLASGWHRVFAAKVANIKNIEAQIINGTKDKALWIASGTNVEHDRAGIRRTNKDKEKSVRMALSHPDAQLMTDVEIAKHCGVTSQTIANWRERLITSHTIQKLNNMSDILDPTPEASNIFIDFRNISNLPGEIKDEINKTNQEIQKTPKSQFNKTNDNIGWASWSWNPVTGCLHDCPYCYARDIANRFYPEGFKPTYHPERLDAPKNTNPLLDHYGGNKVFVCSMADLFGKWVPKEWIDAVIDQVRNNPQWTFLFLTKFPIRMAEFSYPENVWLGTTVDRQYAVDRAEKAFVKIKASGFTGVCWLSCEPMLERLTFSKLDMFDWVVMGGASKSTQTPEYFPPVDDWVSLYLQARHFNCKVYQKTNLLGSRVMEYPTK